ncbi:hypothetical protein D6C97_10579 [Aureobasidium pullulans]|uniref:Uncharacterized protein n=1 Tax=Aureobasidium pullulans TaxID=5580 RepID=A0A4S8WLG9_AURPU|nr:hypothetical protein D6D22_10820 [Aureobasidium pullulans]THY37644.1 hypothetical protein D6C97_10579 [Aureobasidium pullulans]
MVGTPAESPRRRSARLIAEEAEKEKQARLKRYDLPDDGHLDFEKRTEKIRGFDVTRTILVRTTDSVKSDVGDWARKAFYQNNVFYPGQIVRAMLPYPQSDLEARYNPPHGEIAMMKAGPVGCKMRFMVILWTTNYGMFGLPMYTFHGTTSFESLSDERKKDFVGIGIEDLEYETGETSHAGMPIIMNINPNADDADKVDPWAYIDLSRPHAICTGEYLEENIGSIDGNEYLRLVSLYLFRQEDWLKATFKKFQNTEYSAEKLLKPLPVTMGRPESEDLPIWARHMAEVEFRQQINSKRKERRKLKVPGAEVVKKPKKKKKKK